MSIVCAKENCLIIFAANYFERYILDFSIHQVLLYEFPPKISIFLVSAFIENSQTIVLKGFE